MLELLLSNCLFLNPFKAYVLLDFSFNEQSLRKTLRRFDFYRKPSLERITAENAWIDQALSVVANQFKQPPTVRKLKLGAKDAYSLKAGELLLSRKLAFDLKAASQVVSPNRFQIIRCVRSLLEEGVPFNVGRYDIRSFFESISLSLALGAIKDVSSLPFFHTQLIHKLLTHLDLLYPQSGQLRGITISAVVSDLVMRNFDDKLVEHREVFFYARYVDDIIVVSAPTMSGSSLLDLTNSSLPSGLSLNAKKTQFLIINGAKKQGISSPKTLNFLGYEFGIYEQRKNSSLGIRKVKIDIEIRKEKMFKTKIVLALRDYSKKGDLKLLRLRLKFLSTSFSFIKPGSNRRVVSGIAVNYSEVSDARNSRLAVLDTFLVGNLMAFANGNHRFSRSSNFGLPVAEARQLAKHSFVGAHESRCFVAFNPSQVLDIQKIWKNVK